MSPNVDKIIKYNTNLSLPLFSLRKGLPFSLYSKTIAFEILTTYPFSELAETRLIPLEVLESIPNAKQMLNRFVNYKIKNFVESNDTLVVHDKLINLN